MKILLVGAMPTENQYILESLGLKETELLANFYPLYFAYYSSHDVYLIQTFVGSIHAPAASALAIEKIKPDLIIKVGCIGGNSPGIQKNDLIVPKFFFHSGTWLTRSLKNNKP